MKNLWIEAEAFCGNVIMGSDLPPCGCGYGLEKVTDINTGRTYTIIFKGNKNYGYEEREDGSLIYPDKRWKN